MVYQLVHGKTPAAEAASLTDNLLEVDGDYKKVVIANTSPDSGQPISNNQFNAGRPILPEHVPTRLKRHRPLNHPLADYMSAPRMTSYVSSAFKDLVEEFEPGVHQFFEMEVASGKQAIGQMYLFIVCNRLDSLDHDACVPQILSTDRMYTPTYGQSDKLVFSRIQIGEAHIWCDLREIGFWMSDRFADDVFARGLTGVKKTNHFDEVV